LRLNVNKFQTKIYILKGNKLGNVGLYELLRVIDVNESLGKV